jgi:hypothetical protein
MMLVMQNLPMFPENDPETVFIPPLFAVGDAQRVSAKSGIASTIGLFAASVNW